MASLVKQRGMTLIEVMVASLILALVLVAVIVTAGHTQRSGLRLLQKTHAGWVANNVAAQIRAGLQGDVSATGSFQGTQQQGVQQWFWRATAKSQDAHVIFVEVTVHENETSPAIVTRHTGVWRDE